LTHDHWIAIAEAAFGLWLVVHCFLAARREVLTGLAEGLLGNVYRRAQSPIGFWIVVVITFLASLMGAVFLAFGIMTLVWI
jgi:hypothetical protein